MKGSQIPQLNRTPCGVSLMSYNSRSGIQYCCIELMLKNIRDIFYTSNCPERGHCHNKAPLHPSQRYKYFSLDEMWEFFLHNFYLKPAPF